MGRVKYSDFVDRLDVEAIMEAIGFEPLNEDARGNYVGYCVWPENHTHGDTTGKFAIHPEKMVYNCYVCGGGSLLSLVMELNGWDSETAENWLRQFASDTRNDGEFVEDFLNAFANDAESRVSTLPFFNERVLDKYEPAYEYGESIGLNADVIEEYRVLYSDTAKKRSPGNGKFEGVPDYEGPSIIWPHFWKGRLVGWQNRWLGCTACWHDHDPKVACKTCGCDEEFVVRPEFVKKWTNTVDFPKENTLYGYSQVTTGYRLFVVESAKSVLKLRQMGQQAVGTFGSKVNEAQLRLLRKFRTGVVLWADNDKAGQEWFSDCYDYLERFVPLKAVAPVPGAKNDVADMSDKEAIEWLYEYTLDLTVPLM